MKMFTEIGKAAGGIWSLLVGLKITGREFFKPQLTIHYPRREVDNLRTYRGHIDLVGQDEDPAIPRCIMCGKCAEVCPSGCIRLELHLQGEEALSSSPEDCRMILIGYGVEIPFVGRKLPPAEKIERELDAFRLNYNLCSLCGLCVQICPVGSLAFSRDAYLASRSQKDFEFDLLVRLRGKSALVKAVR